MTFFTLAFTANFRGFLPGFSLPARSAFKRDLAKFHSLEFQLDEFLSSSSTLFKFFSNFNSTYTISVLAEPKDFSSIGLHFHFTKVVTLTYVTITITQFDNSSPFSLRIIKFKITTIIYSTE